VDETLAKLREVLIEGQKRSMQGTYQRRAPAKKAVPFLNEALIGLRNYIISHGESAEAWKLLSLAEEVFLHFTAARVALEKSLALQPQRDRKDLQRLAKLKESEKRKADLILPTDKLAELKRHLDEKLGIVGCRHNLQLTHDWLSALKDCQVEAVLDAFRNYGGYCDCEVAVNVL
jgi:hypothetical protein